MDNSVVILSLIFIIIALSLIVLKNATTTQRFHVGLKKYDIRMTFAAIMWNTFWFGLFYFIIGSEKMWEFWYILGFMVVLSLFQYIWKWDYAWALYLASFFFLIFYLKSNHILNMFGKNNSEGVKKEVRFEIFNKETGQVYKAWTPIKTKIKYKYAIQPEINESIRIEIIGKNFYFADTLTGGDNWDVNFPSHPWNADFTITAVK